MYNKSESAISQKFGAKVGKVKLVSILFTHNLEIIFVYKAK